MKTLAQNHHRTHTSYYKGGGRGVGASSKPAGQKNWAPFSCKLSANLRGPASGQREATSLPRARAPLSHASAHAVLTATDDSSLVCARQVGQQQYDGWQREMRREKKSVCRGGARGGQEAGGGTKKGAKTPTAASHPPIAKGEWWWWCKAACNHSHKHVHARTPLLSHPHNKTQNTCMPSEDTRTHHTHSQQRQSKCERDIKSVSQSVRQIRQAPCCAAADAASAVREPSRKTTRSFFHAAKHSHSAFFFFL